MKILKHGNLPNTTKRFTCFLCGCEFEADESEYEQKKYFAMGVLTGEFSSYQTYSCNCPECHKVVNGGR